MTPEEFKIAVQNIIDGGTEVYPGRPVAWVDDPEHGHYQYDLLLEQVLQQLGFGEGISLAVDLTRWYA